MPPPRLAQASIAAWIGTVSLATPSPFAPYAWGSQARKDACARAEQAAKAVKRKRRWSARCDMPHHHSIGKELVVIPRSETAALPPSTEDSEISPDDRDTASVLMNFCVFRKRRGSGRRRPPGSAHEGWEGVKPQTSVATCRNFGRNLGPQFWT